MKKITVIGGGTGTFVVLSGLKKYPLDLAAIVSMMDSGGSTGRLRDQLEVLPPGDFRQCLLALSEAPTLWRKLFLYRFEKGDLKGHNFGNIFISTLEKVCGNYNQVIKTASYLLKINGKVFPVTFEKTNLCVKYENGKILRSESLIDENITEKSRIKKAFLDPKVKANKEAVKRILHSDLIIIGPGDLYTSIIPVFLVDEIKSAIIKTRAKILYIVNLMTKSGQTTNYTAKNHLEDLQKYTGRTPDIVFINKRKIPDSILMWYTKNHESIVKNNINTQNIDQNMVIEDFIDTKEVIRQESDALKRSILRHDPNKLAKYILKFLLV
jgi:uncharacterized cofD-like protein